MMDLFLIIAYILWIIIWGLMGFLLARYYIRKEQEHKNEKIEKFASFISSNEIDKYFVNKLYEELEFRCKMCRIECNLKEADNEFYFELIKTNYDKVTIIKSSKFNFHNAFDLIVSGEYKKFFEELLNNFK